MLAKKIVIFGTGNAGRAIYRAFKDSSEHEIVAFIDNNKDMVGKEYKGISIFAPSEFGKIEFDYIAYSGVWHKEMKEQLKKLGLSQDKMRHIDEAKLAYSTKSKEVAVDEMLKKLDCYLLEKNINYFITGSAGINVLRGRSLSCASDVDIYVLGYDDLLAIKDDIVNIFDDFNVNIKTFKQDTIVGKKGDIERFSITNNAEEKAIIDIGLYHEFGEYRITDYDNEKFFYMPKRVFEAGVIRQKYKDFAINMLAKYDEYFSLIYGKNYIEIPKSWSESDYGNLASIDRIKEICFGKKG